MVSPVETKPVDICQDGLDVLDVLAGWVGIVETHMAAGAFELLANAEVETDRLGVADVQVTVRLGWEARDDPAVVGALGKVFRNDAADEIGRGITGARVGIGGHGAIT